MFLAAPPTTPQVEALYKSSIAGNGYVMNLARAWAWRPDVFDGFVTLRNQLTDRSSLSAREKALIVCATAATLGDSYCALAWGAKLAKAADPEVAAAVIAARESDAMDAREKALAAWVRKVVDDPNGTTARDVEALRAAGFDDREIAEATMFAAFRLAFSAFNDALGARPDLELFDAAPIPVRQAVTFGRAPAGSSSACGGAAT